MAELKFPVFTVKIEHAHTVCTRAFSTYMYIVREGLGTRLVQEVLM